VDNSSKLENSSKTGEEQESCRTTVKEENNSKAGEE
jgi:hypothetical protein